MIMACANCEYITDIIPMFLQRNPSLKICPRCGGELFGKGKTSMPKKTTDQQRRSRDQERRGAKSYHMKRQPGSGAKSGAKSDLVAPGDRRIEMKETTAKSFTLKLEHLMKVEAEAGGARERPILSIEFQGVHPFQRYHVIPDWAFRSLLDELDSLKGGTL